jgi:prepilin-type N-terminal cleavage/methylation domain-containing protein
MKSVVGMKTYVESGRSNRSRGFTLIELVVVIAIVGILAAMLLPALARAKANALSTHCQSNLKQVTRAVTLFAYEHEDHLPYPTDRALDPVPGQLALDLPAAFNEEEAWVRTGQLAFSIADYASSEEFIADRVTSSPLAMACPSFARRPDYATSAPDMNVPDRHRYAYRLRKYGNDVKLWTFRSRLDPIQQPAAEGAIVDLDQQLPGANATTVQGVFGYAWIGAPKVAVHEATRNYGFFDGSVQNLITAEHRRDSMVRMSSPGDRYGWFSARDE